MSDFNLDGKVYRKGSSTGGKAIANIHGNILREGSSSGGKSLCNINGDQIREGSSSGGRKIGTMSDVKKNIENGHGSSLDVAFWFMFIK